jgi:hypothetical protein
MKSPDLAYSPECVEGAFSEVRAELESVASCLRWKGWSAGF